MAKQSGPPVRVKGATTLLVAALLASAALSNCSGAGRWSQPNRTAATTAADLAKCETTAERATLLSRGQTRGAYGVGNAPGVAGGAGSQSPMGLHDRADAAGDFRDSVARCMTGLGYVDAREPVTSRQR